MLSNNYFLLVKESIGYSTYYTKFNFPNISIYN